MTDDSAAHPVPSKPRAGLLALAGLLTTLVGGVSYFLLMSITWIRVHAIPNIALVIVGSAICWYAVSRKRGKLIIAGTVLSSLVTVGFLLAIFVLMRLPPPQKDLAIGSQPPDFTLPSHEGAPISLSDYRGKGPVFIVFYRGFW